MSFRMMTLLAAVSGMAAAAQADDWPQWGGPERDIVWRETGIAETLPKPDRETGMLPRVWSTPIYEGYSGPAVAQGKVFITDYVPQLRIERALCLDAETGKELWKHTWPVVYTISYPNGPRATPVVDGERVYIIGAQGNFFCLNHNTGKVIWEKNFVNDFQTKVPIWGMAASPLVDGDQLITLVGGSPNALIVSFNKLTGEEIWRSQENADVGYCPPVIFRFGDSRQLIVWHPNAVCALEPTTGKLIWEIPFRVQFALCIPTPRKVGNHLFVTAFYDGPLMIEVAEDGKSAKIAWKGKSSSEINTDGLHSIMPTPIMTDKYIYGVCSYGQLRCIDATQGSRIWESTELTGQDRWWNAFLIPHQDRVFIANEQGELIITRLTPEGPEILSREQLLEPTRKVRRRMTIWSHPAFAMKSVFARNDYEIIRVDLSAKE